MKTYSGPPPGAAGRKARKTGVHTVGNVVVAESSRSQKQPYNRALHRMREIEALVELRFGKTLPERVDHTPYLSAIGYCANVMDEGNALGEVLHGWCARFAPHLLVAFDDVLEPIRRQIEGRRFGLSVEDAGRIVGLTWIERSSLSIKTMDASDISKAEQKALVAAHRREENKRRKSEERRLAKSKDRATWLAEHRTEKDEPWVALGISRSTYFERKRRNWTGPAHVAHDGPRTGPAQDTRTGPALTRTPVGNVAAPVQTEQSADALEGVEGCLIPGTGASPMTGVPQTSNETVCPASFRKIAPGDPARTHDADSAADDRLRRRSRGSSS
ncbi:hypothetical protein [Mesorhizobium sp. Mes31]|uniref:hypothetical protein n=1 Tax=Mesorhizobium sp. Mes31 TaxID=2926017 RepID=UPI002118BC15|nr:hypothetical protein [Mesorhizobium sp. Mes31]